MVTRLGLPVGKRSGEVATPVKEASPRGDLPGETFVALGCGEPKEARLPKELRPKEAWGVE